MDARLNMVMDVSTLHGWPGGVAEARGLHDRGYT